MPGIGVVVNPRAGGNRRWAARAARLRAVVGDCGVVHEPRDLKALAEVAAGFREDEVEIVAVCGGDGSMHQAVSALVPVYGSAALPPMLPLRAGTINYVAATVGCRRGSPEKVLSHVVRQYRLRAPYDTTERDTVCVNGGDYGFVVGCGAVVNFLQLYYGRQGTGSLSAARLLARVIVSGLLGSGFARSVVQPVEADILCDDERVPFRVFTVVLAGTVAQIALGCKPMYLANRKRGYLHLVAGPIGPWAVLKKLRRLRRGFPMEEPTLYDNLARRVTVRFARPAPYMVDGDLVAPVGELDVTAGPRITFIRG
jgi:diacylglycerol kinase family enzyme